MHFCKLLAFICLFGFSFLAVAQDQEQVLDYGQRQNGTYSNNYFGFSVNIPKGWSVKTEEEQKQIQKLGGELMAGDDAAMKSLVKASEVRTVNLLLMSQHEVGAPVEFNPTFGIVAENTKLAPGIKTGNDYLFHAKKLLEKSQVKHTFDKEVYNKKIGNQDFAILEATISYPTATFKQNYYVTVKKDYCLILMTVYHDKETKKQMDKILSSVVFN